MQILPDFSHFLCDLRAAVHELQQDLQQRALHPRSCHHHHQQVDSPFAIWWSCHLKTCQTQCGDNTKFLIPLLCVWFTNLIDLVVLLNSLQKQDRNLFGKSLGDRSIIFIDIVPWHLPSITAWILAIYLGSWTCFQTQCIYDRQGVCRQIWWQIFDSLYLLKNVFNYLMTDSMNHKIHHQNGFQGCHFLAIYLVVAGWTCFQAFGRTQWGDFGHFSVNTHLVKLLQPQNNRSGGGGQEQSKL